MILKLINLFFLFPNVCSILFPQVNYYYLLNYFKKNEFRQIDSLDGLWTFVREPINTDGIGFKNNWSQMDLSHFSVGF